MTGEYLSKRIKAAQLTKKELADRMNVVPQLIDGLCKSKSVGSGKLEQVCKAIGKPINFLYEGYEGDAYTYFPEPIIINEGNKSESEVNINLSKAVNQMREKLDKKDEIIEKKDGIIEEKDKEIKDLRTKLDELTSQYMVLNRKFGISLEKEDMKKLPGGL